MQNNTIYKGKNLKGSKFKTLLVIGLAKEKPEGSKNKHLYWECRCDECGFVGSWPSNLLKTETASCPCQAKRNRSKSHLKHNMSFTRTYGCWGAMKDRCYRSTHEAYKNYGGRGIIVCERWLDKEKGFLNFLEDMGECPSKNHSLDRFPNMNGNYEPSNCRWATQKEQCNNTRNNKFLTYNGETKTLKQWDELVFGSKVIGSRLKAGWSIEKAISTPKLHS